jgi:hypothetical protein
VIAVAIIVSLPGATSCLAEEGTELPDEWAEGQYD